MRPLAEAEANLLALAEHSKQKYLDIMSRLQKESLKSDTAHVDESVQSRRHCGGRKNAAKPAAKPAAPSNSAASSASTKVLDPVGFIQNELQKLQQLQIHGYMKPETHVARARYIEEHGYVPDAGVGMTISETHPFTIVDLRPNGPAGKAAGAIKIGDELTKVDGGDWLNATLTGDQVLPPSLSLARALSLSLVRQHVQAPSSTYTPPSRPSLYGTQTHRQTQTHHSSHMRAHVLHAYGSGDSDPKP